MKRILVVEDNETNLYLIRFILKKSGYEVIEAREGTAGVELAIKEKPDLIIMDIQLPAKLKPIHDRHHNVGDNHVKGFGAKFLQGFLAICSRFDLVTAPLQQSLR
ncbi:unnamed protein product [marine sediment metagenome]|uniref:Response regulatory domain-containing protein n=1 Tax=marine sediment metagenome TaxID=412755 RepID=X1H3I7_9ZZZZ